MKTKEDLIKGIENYITAIRPAALEEDLDIRIMLSMLATELFKIVLKEYIPKEQDREMINWIITSGAKAVTIEEEEEDRAHNVEMLRYTLFKILLGDVPEEPEKDPPEPVEEVEIKSLLN